VTGALEAAPDQPRWIEARAMLLGGAPVEPAGAGWVVGSADHGLHAAIGDADAGAVAAIAAARGGTLLVALERDDVVAAVRARGWSVERALLHTLPDPGSLPDDDGAAVLGDDVELDRLPAELAAELARARRAGRPIHAAWVDGAPVSFAHAPWRTERWFDVSVDTVRAARQLGLATRVAAAMIRAERALGREPVWGAVESNTASLRLAGRLGFTPADALWVATSR